MIIIYVTNNLFPSFETTELKFMVAQEMVGWQFAGPNLYLKRSCYNKNKTLKCNFGVENVWRKYLARTKANSCELIFHFLDTSFLPLGNSSLRIWLLSVSSPKLLIEQPPLLKQSTISHIHLQLHDSFIKRGKKWWSLSVDIKCVDQTHEHTCNFYEMLASILQAYFMHSQLVWLREEK